MFNSFYWLLSFESQEAQRKSVKTLELNYDYEIVNKNWNPIIGLKNQNHEKR